MVVGKVGAGILTVESKLQDLKLSNGGGELDATWVNIDSDEGESCATSDWDSPGSSPPDSPRVQTPSTGPADTRSSELPIAANGKNTHGRALEADGKLAPSTPETTSQVVKPQEPAKAAPTAEQVAVATPPVQPAAPAPKPDFDLSTDYCRAELDSVQELAKDRTFKVTLKTTTASTKPLQMFIGDSEGKALLQAFSGWKWHQQGCKRPLTYDFMRSVVEALGRKVAFVRICASERGVFYARAHFEAPAGAAPTVGDATLAGVDSRPSDALNLALRFGAPIYVHRQLVTEYP
jgi:bifunctional DNase/RNase